MKCALPDCVNRFSGHNKKEYGVIKFTVDRFTTPKDPNEPKRRDKIKICKTCSDNRPLKEVIDTYLNQDGKGGLSEKDEEIARDGSFFLDLDKPLGEQD